MKEIAVPKSVPKGPPVALLVDDHPTSRRSNQFRLEKQGYVVLLAENEAEALDQARQSSPTAIFLHLGFTDLRNLPLIEALRADDGCRHIPVVVLSDQPDTRAEKVSLHAVHRDVW